MIPSLEGEGFFLYLLLWGQTPDNTFLSFLSRQDVEASYYWIMFHKQLLAIGAELPEGIVLSANLTLWEASVIILYCCRPELLVLRLALTLACRGMSARLRRRGLGLSICRATTVDWVTLG